MALDHGSRGTDALQSLYRTLTRPNIGTKPCHSVTIKLQNFLTLNTSSPAIPPLVSSEFIVELLAGDIPIPVHLKFTSVKNQLYILNVQVEWS